jgi:hypothetical protein
MRRPFIYKALLVVSMVASAPSLTTRAAPDKLREVPSTIQDGEQGVVLLQDGGLLEGTVTKTVQWYVVARANSQLQVASSRMLFIGHTPHEAYEFRVKNTTQPTGDAHLALTEWCLRHNLVDEASQEIGTARRLGANEIRAGLLERRLAATKFRLSQKSEAPASAVVQASAEQEVPATISRDLPPGALEMFTRKVQPVLVNNCTLSKCHEPGGAQAFQLNRAILRGESNRRTTMQNLAAALTLIDREHPEGSKLLTVPRKTHGGMNGPVLGVRQDQAFKHLSEWVALLAPSKAMTPIEVEDPKPAGTMVAAESPNPNVRRRARPTTAAVVQAIAHESPGDAGKAAGVQDAEVQPAVAIEPSAPPTLRQPHQLRVGATAQQWQPRDPFDPEIFNRMQKAQSQPSSAASSPKFAPETKSASKTAAKKNR